MAEPNLKPRDRAASLEKELSEARKQNPGTSMNPSPVQEAKDYVKSWFYHLKKTYGA